LLATALLCPAACLAGAPTKEQIAQWVKDLGDSDFEVRERASKQLWEAGEAAEAAVVEATRSADAEVARRAGELADKFRWGIYPTTPLKVVDLVGRYRAADVNGKLALVRELLDTGAPGCTTLLKIVRVERDAGLRRRLSAQVVQEASHAVPGLLADGSFTNLEALLELGVEAEAEAALPGYAAYWLVRDGLNEAVGRWKALAAGPRAARANEVLTYLYRAQGDLTAARGAAEKAGKADLIEEVLYQQGDWKALAKRPTTTEFRREIEALGYRAAYQRLAGDGDAFERTVADIRRHAEGRAENDVETWYAAKVLFLNDRPADALGLLAKLSHHADLRVEVLAAQGRYRDAFAVADGVKADHPRKPLVELLRARLLYTLGEKEKATTIFARMADGLKDGEETHWQERLVAVEYQLGLREQAQEHCGRVLAVSRSPTRAAWLLGKVFPGRGDEAAALWGLLLQGKDVKPAEAMAQLQRLLGGKATPADLAALGELADKNPVVSKDVRWAAYMGVAAAAAAAGHDALATTWLEKAAAKGYAPALLKLADRLAEKKEWTAAAARYAEAWARDTSDPLPLYLRGHAQAMAGKGDEGSLWMGRARLLPLGNEFVRQTFADALQERGHVEAARRERDILVKVGLPGSFCAGDALRQFALFAAARRDDVLAADLHEKSMLRCLDARVSFQESGAYVAVPAAVHRYRAVGLLRAGRFDEARKEIALCEALLPGDVDLPCRAVPVLDRLGRKTEADDLFGHCRDLHEKLCREYPKSAREHNSVAWLAACCRRELGRGLEHAQQAVTLTPDSASVHDTLGEIHFQRGETKKAVTAARKSIELAPKTEYYKRQLKRIEAGDPKADLPTQGDD
jgi:tetratricopeptide (TPR) repeat protein